MTRLSFQFHAARPTLLRAKAAGSKHHTLGQQPNPLACKHPVASRVGRTRPHQGCVTKPEDGCRRRPVLGSGWGHTLVGLSTRDGIGATSQPPVEAIQVASGRRADSLVTARLTAALYLLNEILERRNDALNGPRDILWRKCIRVEL